MARNAANGSAAGIADADEQPFPIIAGDGGEPEREADSPAGDGGIPTFRPGDVISGEPEPEPRRRGRPRGSRAASGTKAKQTSQDLTGVLLSAHMMLAALIKAPEMEITEAEAKRLGEAVSRVNDEFGGLVMSPKTAACLNLAMAMGSVYGPRAVAVANRVKKERKKAAGPVTIDATVVH